MVMLFDTLCRVNISCFLTNSPAWPTAKGKPIRPVPILPLSRCISVCVNLKRKTEENRSLPKMLSKWQNYKRRHVQQLLFILYFPLYAGFQLWMFKLLISAHSLHFSLNIETSCQVHVSINGHLLLYFPSICSWLYFLVDHKGPKGVQRQVFRGWINTICLHVSLHFLELAKGQAWRVCGPDLARRSPFENP